ncbi:hypothetical protein T11_3855 [Trichinella zimbabwensis]|uniref:Uncharacterized protein n=1 Tax=Trichinella zimbabwensis TaxID=268475 RepID=A0A0V1GNX6_9BILA|nr:hypothetical protein T11_3855 [Trichinella zimbabwensis]
MLYPWLIFHFDGVRLAVAVRNKSASEKSSTLSCVKKFIFQFIILRSRL